MKCNCIETVEENLRKTTNDPLAKLDVMYEFPDLNRRIYVPYTFREQKKDGTFTKEKQGKLALGKCPFCGKSAKR